MTDVLKPHRIGVGIEGTLVVLTIGNADIKMDYDTALKLSTWLRVRGKEAKRIAGDTSRHWTVIGKLDDLEKGADTPF